MSRCQHCGQGAIAEDINGPVCPDCWDEGYYETSNHMTDETEMPELIWAKVKTFSRFYGVNRETEERREWCESYATPEIAYICGAVEYTRADISDAKDKRIAELEQLVATLEANLADADALTSAAFTDGASNNVRLAETSHRIAELEAKLAKAVAGLEESQPEIDQYIQFKYPSDHPVHERYRKRDFSANPARLALAEIKEPK